MKRHVADKIFVEEETDYRERFDSERERAATAVWGYESQNENWYELENEEIKADEKMNITGDKKRWYLIYFTAVGSLRLIDQRRGKSRKSCKQ